MLYNVYVLMAKSMFFVCLFVFWGFFAINKIDMLQKIKSKQYQNESCPEAQTM